MRVTQLMLIVMSGLALAGCPKKPQTLPDASNPPEQTGAATTGAHQRQRRERRARLTANQRRCRPRSRPARSSTSITTAPRSSRSSCRSSPRTPSTSTRNAQQQGAPRRPLGRARLARVQHRSRRAPRAGGAPRADAAGCDRGADHDRELRRGASGGAGQRRVGVRQESPRRAGLRPLARTSRVNHDDTSLRDRCRSLRLARRLRNDAAGRRSGGPEAHRAGRPLAAHRARAGEPEPARPVAADRSGAGRSAHAARAAR